MRCIRATCGNCSTRRTNLPPTFVTFRNGGKKFSTYLAFISSVAGRASSIYLSCLRHRKLVATCSCRSLKAPFKPPHQSYNPPQSQAVPSSACLPFVRRDRDRESARQNGKFCRGLSAAGQG